MKRATLVAVLSGLALASPAAAVTVRNDASTADNSGFPSTGIVNGDLSLGGNGANNGVLITDRHVLTAAHIVAGQSTAATTFIVRGVTYGVEQITVHPNWTGDFLAGNDIAVLRLAAAVPTPAQNAAAGVTPARLYTGAAEVGQPLTLLGVGRTGNGTTGGTTFPGSIRSATNVYDRAGNVTFNTEAGPRTAPNTILFFDFDSGLPTDDRFGGFVQTPQEGMIASNDSGGGSFVTIGTDTFVAGIHSFVAFDQANPPPGKYGDIGADTRVSSHLGFINAAIPEPASTATLAAAAAAGLLTRRRRR
ncbi:MAG: hypothetical protein AVDCRST_MAG64-3326 [uncultured Phycisphaerae bacterium]|uniref:Peptidase S1 domain-containing protein n=1 Tax=uncultured Phycisphaerae bacterium TaxID=904963 RepID=A0A6J4PZ43_9BACT|nr:MAG: hypothetical protein AVDCRST_MAG64-3326 [uncultured Phycisphaerae bacterium]